jgi:hypothetical protein
MPCPTANAEERRKRLCGVLLDLLWAAQLPAWPGADGLTVDEVLLCYPAAAAAGRVPGLHQLLDRYADLEDDLRTLFAPVCCHQDSAAASAPPEYSRSEAADVHDHLQPTAHARGREAHAQPHQRHPD